MVPAEGTKHSLQRPELIDETCLVIVGLEHSYPAESMNL